MSGFKEGRTMSVDDLADKPLFEMGTWVGRRQAFGLLATKSAVADAECLKRLRDGKEYKLAGMTWEELCQRHLGVSRAQADRLISQLDEFGTAYFELSKIVRISADAFRDIADAVTENSIEYNGETIPIKTENGPKIENIIRLLREEVARPRRQPAAEGMTLQKLSRRLDACFTELAAMSARPLQPEDRAAAEALIESTLDRLGRLSTAFQQLKPAA
jgi:hypothetical protein